MSFQCCGNHASGYYRSEPFITALQKLKTILLQLRHSVIRTVRVEHLRISHLNSGRRLLGELRDGLIWVEYSAEVSVSEIMNINSSLHGNYVIILITTAFYQNNGGNDLQMTKFIMALFINTSKSSIIESRSTVTEEKISRNREKRKAAVDQRRLVCFSLIRLKIRSLFALTSNFCTFNFLSI